MTIPSLFQEIAHMHPDVISQYSRGGEGNHFQPTTYRELYGIIEGLSFALADLGIAKGDHIGLICDNRKEWLALDLALLSLGAADVPRGCDTMGPELEYILGFSECPVAIIENIRQMEKILPFAVKLPVLKKIILIDCEDEIPNSPWEVITYASLLEKGLNEVKSGYLREQIAKGEGSDLATLIYTSGTTGEPKGVMLTHDNFYCQVTGIHEVAKLAVEDIWLSVLPVWHSFERIIQYIAIGAATTIAYSKPVGKIMLMDLQTLNPQWMASVPRIWSAIESGVTRNIKSKGSVAWGLFRFFMAVASAHQAMQNRLQGRVADFKKSFTLPFYILYPIPWLLLYPLRMLGNKLIFSKIQEKVGTRFKAGISGGGALPPRLYKFFKAIGIQILEGYGLTETAPVVAFSSQFHPVMGVVGRPYPKGTAIRVVDETGTPLPPGEKGVVMIRGAQVMKGYFRKPPLRKR